MLKNSKAVLEKQDSRPPIMRGRTNIRPYQYPEFDQQLLNCFQSPWSHLEIPMSGDIENWKIISDRERKVIGGILKGFTLIEIGVGCYWRDIVAKSFPHPEIAMLATTFSHTENIHVKSYDYLESSIGLDTYEAFINDPVAVKKLDLVLNNLKDEKSLALSLAIFSGAVEGVSLFSSFAVLLSFCKEAMFQGMSQILSYSAIEENQHSMVGIQLYKKLIEEAPELKPKDEEIYEGFNLVVENENNFINNIFSEGDLPTVKREDVIDFIHYRANNRLMELGLKPQYVLSGAYKEIKHYFNTIIKGKTMNDFFAQSRNGGGYSSKITQDFNSVSY